MQITLIGVVSSPDFCTPHALFYCHLYCGHLHNTNISDPLGDQLKQLML